MRNHFHLVVETPNGNLVAGMRWLLSTYTLRLNHRRKLFGHVFSGRYKALVVDGRSQLELAARLRRGTTLTIREIAQRLHLGSWKSATTRLHNLKRKEEQSGTMALL